jgi:hypothetical protein
MRQALDDALRLSPVPTVDVAYPSGSIVVCYSCGIPLYRLTRNIYVGQSAANPSETYAPISLELLRQIAERRDIDAGIRGAINAMSVDDQRLHCDTVPWPLVNGVKTTCNKCHGSWTFQRTSADADGAKQLLDSVGVIQLATIPPVGKARRLTVAG